MADDYFTRSQAVARPPERKSSRTRILLGAMFAAFLIGVGLAGFAFYSGMVDAAWNSTAKVVEQQTGQKLVPAGPQPALAQPAIAAVADQQDGLEARVAGMEERLNKLDLQSQASAGNAARAEGLLIAFSTRRAIERGEPLGYLEDQLNLRFGAAEPGAVKDIIAAARSPITQEQLTARLDDLSPVLASEADGGVSWAWFQRQLGELFIVRKQSSPSPLPEDRLARARVRLQSGMIDGAIGEVQNLPGGDSDAAKAWIADAQRYGKAMNGLDRIERAAILEPRQLRDASGKQVQQASPVAAPTAAVND
jgi:hypothetical protein